MQTSAAGVRGVRAWPIDPPDMSPEGACRSCGGAGMSCIAVRQVVRTEPMREAWTAV